jgi:hypothetical protein
MRQRLRKCKRRNRCSRKQYFRKILYRWSTRRTIRREKMKRKFTLTRAGLIELLGSINTTPVRRDKWQLSR